MPRWSYRHVEVFRAGGHSAKSAIAKLTRVRDEGTYLYVSGNRKDRLFDRQIKDGLLLNPQRDWGTILHADENSFRAGKESVMLRQEVFAWDDDAGYADLAIEIINKLGSQGWELVGIDQERYIFKRAEVMGP